jgi:hypothetical protein
VHEELGGCGADEAGCILDIERCCWLLDWLDRCIRGLYCAMLVLKAPLTMGRPACL